MSGSRLHRVAAVDPPWAYDPDPRSATVPTDREDSRTAPGGPPEPPAAAGRPPDAAAGLRAGELSAVALPPPLADLRPPSPDAGGTPSPPGIPVLRPDLPPGEAPAPRAWHVTATPAATPETRPDTSRERSAPERQPRESTGDRADADLGVGPPAVLRVPAAALRAIGKQDARRFAAQFTADYLSWDEDHPQWRSDTLRRYVDTTPEDTASRRGARVARPRPRRG